MGLLRPIAEGFGITEPEAGHIISAYALGVVVGAPLLTVAAARMRRRHLLLVLMAMFVVGNAAGAFAPDQTWLIAARFVAGIPHGAYFGVASLVAASMAGPGRQARSVAWVLMGLSVANVVGVPAATWLGGMFGWQSAFLTVAVIGVLTFVAIAVTVPEPHGIERVRAADEISALARSQGLLTLAVGTVGFGGMFAVYSYISWTMTEVSGLDPTWMPAVLATYGVGMVVGNFLGGWLADRDLERGMLFALAFMTVVLLVFAVAVRHPVPGLQARRVRYAGRGQTLAAALNHSALNAANALGAWIGGVVIALGLGYTAPALAGAGLAVTGFVVLAFAVVAARRRRSTDD